MRQALVNLLVPEKISNTSPIPCVGLVHEDKDKTSGTLWSSFKADEKFDGSRLLSFLDDEEVTTGGLRLPIRGETLVEASGYEDKVELPTTSSLHSGNSQLEVQKCAP